MKQYQIYRSQLTQLPNSDKLFEVTMVPEIQLTASSPENALRIAKQKGHLRAIVGEVPKPSPMRMPTNLRSYLRMGVQR